MSEHLPIPASSIPVHTEGVSTKDLSVDEIKSRLDARQRDLQFHLRSIGQEVGLIADDVVIEERPFIDRVRQRPLAAVGLAIASGAVLGILWGLRSRTKGIPVPDDREDVLQYHVSALLDAAARRVARGETADDALAHEMRKRPVVFVPRPEKPEPPERSGTRKAFDSALKTALGMGTKAGMDMLTKQLTPHAEVMEAVADEVGG